MGGLCTLNPRLLQEKDIQFFKPLILNEYLDAVKLYGVRDLDNTIHGFIGILDGCIEMLFISPNSMGKGLGR